MSFGDFVWGMVIFFFWVMYLWMFIAIFGDIFRRGDLSGWFKAGWIFLIFFLPLIGILLYLVTRPKLTEEEQAMMVAAEEPRPGKMRYSTADEIEKAKKLLASGAITAEEFAGVKKKALAV